MEGAQEGIQCWIFENGLLKDHPFRKKLWKRNVKFVLEMLTMVEPFMILEEKLTTRFNNPASTKSHLNFTTMNESHQHWDNSNRGMLGKHDKYTPLEVSCEKTYLDYINTEF